MLKSGNLLDDSGGKSKAEAFDEVMSSQSAKIERIVATRQTTPIGQWYEQPRNEWVVVIAGEARLRSNV